MAITNIPTGNLPYITVDELPQTGEANTIYGLKVSEAEDIPIYEDYRFHDGNWERVNLGDQVFGFLFNDYQESVAETVAAMEQVIEEQAAKILELEEEVFPVVSTSFDMSITSLIQTELELYDEFDEIVPNMGLMTEYWEDPQEITYQNEVRKGTYYLKNEDGYALGTPNGQLQPLVCEGGIVDLGSVEVIMMITGEAEPMIDEGDEE
jgi:hypothetical protein